MCSSDLAPDVLAYLETTETLLVGDDCLEGLEIAANSSGSGVARLDEGSSIGVLESGNHPLTAREGGAEIHPVVLLRGKRPLDLEGDGPPLDAGGHLEAVQLAGAVPLGDDAVGGLAGDGIAVPL